MDSIRTRSGQRSHHAKWRPYTLALTLALGVMSSACTPEDDVAPSVPEISEQPGGSTSAPTIEVETAATANDASESSDSNATADNEAELADLAGAASVTLVEDWAALASADEVEDTITRNLGVGDNAMALSLDADQASAPLDGDVLVVTYDILESPPHDFVGFNRDLDSPADWSGASAIAMWVGETTDADVNIVFQFRELSGEVWRHQGPMPTSDGDTPVVLPLDPATFTRANWSTTENGTLDLDEIDQYGVYVGHTGPGKSGVVHLGPIALLR